MTELEFRTAITTEALTWVGTPYRSCGRIKGVGVNCAQLLFGVALGAGVIPADSPEPKWYTAQLATHCKEERLVEYVKVYGGVEIKEEDIKSGDIFLYRSGQSHGHAAIVIEWPEKILHCLPTFGVQMGRADEGQLHAFTRRYFTLWRPQ